MHHMEAYLYVPASESDLCGSRSVHLKTKKSSRFLDAKKQPCSKRPEAADISPSQQRSTAAKLRTTLYVACEDSIALETSVVNGRTT